MTMLTLGALKGAGVLAAAGVMSLLLRKGSASLRHLVWTGALMIALALPVLQFSGPRVEIPVPASWLGQWSAMPAGSSPIRQLETREASTVPMDWGATDGSRGTPRSEAGPPVGARVPADVAAAAPFQERGSPVAGAVVLAMSDVLVLFWALGVLLILAGTLFEQLAARSLAWKRVAEAPPELRRRCDELAASLGLKGPVRLVVSGRIRIPATWGLLRSTIVLPADYGRWNEDTIDRVLLHELAHVQRRDCLARLLGSVTRAVHWPNPLVWIAVRRQRVESERASDDLVVTHGGLASAYAEDLVELVRTLRGSPRLPQAAVGMARSSDVRSRVRAILDPRIRRGRVGRVAMTAAGLTCVAIALAMTSLVPVARAQERPLGVASVPVVESLPDPQTLTPTTVEVQLPSEPVQSRSVFVAEVSTPRAAPSQELCATDADGQHSTSVHIDDDLTRIRWETSSCRVDVEMEGRVEFASDDSGIVAMSNGAAFELEVRIDGSRRRVRFEGASGGEMERRYWVDGNEEPWGPAGEQWLALALPDLFRHTTINAEARVARLLEAGGPDRVFLEVGQIRSDHVAATYLELLMDQAQLSGPQYTTVIESAGSLESDHIAASVLLAVVAEAGLQPSFQGPLLQAADGIESDHQRAMVLQAVLETDLSMDQLDAVVRSAVSIESDHQLAAVLSTVARQDRLSVAGRAAFIAAVGSIESDHQHTLVVNAFLDAGPLSGDELSQVLAMTRGIESDHQRASILGRVASEYDLTGVQIASYLDAVSELESDHQIAMTAEAILDRSSVTSEQLRMVLSIADAVESDHQRAAVLTSVIQGRTLSDGEIAEVIRVAAGIGSDHQLSATLVALVTGEDLSPAAVLAVVEAASSIGSDHNQATVLMAVAENHAVEGDVRERYRALAEDMSRGQRDMVLAALVR